MPIGLCTLSGTHFGPEGLTLAARTIEQFVERALRLYEQEPGELGGSSRLGYMCDVGSDG